MKRRILVAVVLAGLLVAPIQSLAADFYLVRGLGKVIPASINKWGDVVGCKQAVDYSLTAFALINGKPYDLQSKLSGQESRAFGINDNRSVVGYTLDTSSGWLVSGFIYKPGQSPKTISQLTLARDINNAGTIVGDVSDENGHFGAILKNGQITVLPPLPGCYGSVALSINKYDWVVGYSMDGDLSYATLWRYGQPISLQPSDPTCTWSEARSINDSCQIIGGAEYTGLIVPSMHRYKALMWTSPEPVVLSDFGMDDAFAYDINNYGQIVGRARISDQETRAVIWKQGVVSDLSRLVPTGWTTDTGMAINDSGMIAFTGTYRGEPYGGIAIPKRR